MAVYRFFTRTRLSSRHSSRLISSSGCSTSSAGSQYTPWMRSSACQVLSWASSASVAMPGSTTSAVAPRFWSFSTSFLPTPPWSNITTTRLLASSVTPVALQTSSEGRKAGTGTRRGILSASSRVPMVLIVTAGCAAGCAAGAGAAAAAGAPAKSARSGRIVLTNWTTLLRVG